MKKLVLKKPTQPAEPKPWHHPDNFEDSFWATECRTFIAKKKNFTDFELNAMWRGVTGDEETPLHDKPRWMIELGIEYYLQIQGQKRAMKKVDETLLRRYGYAIKFQKQLLKKESEFFDERYQDDYKGDTDMAKKNGNGSTKEKKEKRITAGSVLIPLLSADKVKSDEALIAEVKEKTGSTKFDEKQLAWYKWKFREGKLKGMDGKKHVINQGSPLKKKAQDKADKGGRPAKKLVLKKKEVKEPVEA